jgi:hypothetical protein
MQTDKGRVVCTNFQLTVTENKDIHKQQAKPEKGCFKIVACGPKSAFCIRTAHRTKETT